MLKRIQIQVALLGFYTAFVSAQNLSALHSVLPEATTDDACTDLFGAACKDKAEDLDANEKTKRRALQAELASIIQKKYGESPELLIKRALEADGILLKEDLSPEKLKSALIPYYEQSSDADWMASVLKEDFDLCSSGFPQPPEDEQRSIENLKKDIESLSTRELLPVGIFNSIYISDEKKIPHSPFSDVVASKSGQDLLRRADDWSRDDKGENRLAPALFQVVEETSAKLVSYNEQSYAEVLKQEPVVHEYLKLCDLLKILPKDEGAGPVLACGVDNLLRSEYTSLGFLKVATVENLEKQLNTLRASVISKLAEMDSQKIRDSGKLNFLDASMELSQKNAAELADALESFPIPSVDRSIKAWDFIKNKIDNDYQSVLGGENIKAKLTNTYDMRADSASRAALCKIKKAYVLARMKSLIGKYYNQLPKSKEAVIQFTDEAFPKTQEIRTELLFQRAKSAVKAVMKEQILPRIKDEKIKHRAEENFERTVLYHPADPRTLPYIKDQDTGIEVLDLGAIDAFDTYYQSYQSDSLEHLSTINAESKPAMGVGYLSTEPTVYFYPAFAAMTEHNDAAALATLTHEIGHQLDPQLSTLAGYSLSAVYKPLSDCLMSDVSMNANGSQLGESIADWISAEATAKILSQMSESSKDQQREFALNLAKDYCSFAQSRALFGVGTDVHPSDYRRVNRIYGAQPAIREALGCKGKPSKYPYCTLGGNLNGASL